MLPFMESLDTQEDIDKLDALYQATNKTLYHYALSLLKNREAAEDAVQEIYCYMAKGDHIKKIYDPYSNESANYMIISIKYQILHMLDKQKKTETVEWDEEMSPYTAKSEVEDEVIGFDGYAHMSDALKELSESYREILTLRYYLDHSVEEMAVELGVTIDNVSVRLHRARAALRTKMLSADNAGTKL